MLYFSPHIPEEMVVMERETYKGKRYYVAHYRESSLVFKSYWMPDTFGLGADALSALRASGIVMGYEEWDELFIDGPFLFQRQARKAASNPIPDMAEDEDTTESRFSSYKDLLVKPEYARDEDRGLAIDERDTAGEEDASVIEEGKSADDKDGGTTEIEESVDTDGESAEKDDSVKEEPADDEGEPAEGEDEQANEESESPENGEELMDAEGEPVGDGESLADVNDGPAGDETEKTDDEAGAEQAGTGNRAQAGDEDDEAVLMVPADEYYEAVWEAGLEECPESAWPEDLTDEEYNAIWTEPEDEEPETKRVGRHARR